MDLQCFRSRLKIRRAPSFKISATSSSSQTSSSFHGSCSRQMKKKGCCRSKVRQPLIFHMFDPEIIVTEPAEFMAVVQRHTGSAHTRALWAGQGVSGDELQEEGKEGMQERRCCKDPLKEGTTVTLAPSSPKHDMGRNLPEREIEELSRTREGLNWSPGSPNSSSLSTSSEGGAACFEDASTNFFVFSEDSYYGNFDQLEPHNSIPFLDSSSDDDHFSSMLPS